MLAYLRDNKTWIFSGIGVAVLFGGIELSRRWLAGSAAAAPESVSVQEIAVRSDLVLLNDTRRIQLGDFATFGQGHHSVRVNVSRISVMKVTSYAGPRDEDSAQLDVDLGGAVVEGGRETNMLGVNSFALPALDKGNGADEDRRCVFEFFSSDMTFSFTSICVSHINPVAQVVDVRVQQVLSEALLDF